MSKSLATLAMAVLAALSSPASAQLPGTLDPVLAPLLTFEPGWVTRSITSHDPRGGNGDNQGFGVAMEDGYRVLFHGKGEGRILRIWMTSYIETNVPAEYQEIVVITDGITVFKGKPTDFFDGQGPWASPLVHGYLEGSGGFSSYVPFPYAREAKVLFKGFPNYYQITYREGAGASSGPTAADLNRFLSEEWRAPLNAAAPSAFLVGPGAPQLLAQGPTTVTGLSLKLADGLDLPRLWVRVGKQDAVPAAFFFGMGTMGGLGADRGWTTFRNSLDAADEDTATLWTRLPVPLAKGEKLVLEYRPTDADSNVRAAGQVRLTAIGPVPGGARFMTQFRDQKGPGTRTTMPFFETDEPVQLASLVEEITEGQPGSRQYLEGDEMIRTDGMFAPVQLGTGTEDYFNGGWYFLGTHANPLSGQPRFVVNDPEDGWSHARYEHSLYRHHVADPVVSRRGLRFGFEAGDEGAYTPVRYRTLARAYTFGNSVKVVGQSDVVPADLETHHSAVDAEAAQQPQSYRVRDRHDTQTFSFHCPAKADGMLLTRVYDATIGGQEAQVSVGGRPAGVFFEAYANAARQMAQDALWIGLWKGDCKGGNIEVTIDASASEVRFTEGTYSATFYDTGSRLSAVKQGDRVRIFATEGVRPYATYVNDHTIVKDPAGAWHLYGIFHPEPIGHGEEVDLVHGFAQTLDSDPGNWGENALKAAPQNDSIALTADAEIGETHLWAPYVVVADGLMQMFMQGGGMNGNDAARIERAVSGADGGWGVNWTRQPGTPLFEDICVARDPMVMPVGDLWVLYYTRCDSTETQRAGVAYRVSRDLVSWSEPRQALTLTDATPMFNSGHTESPYVFHRGGWYYLSVTNYPDAWDRTWLYRSRTPFQFEPVPVAGLTAHAGEWLAQGQDWDNGDLYLTHAGAGQGGVWMSKVDLSR